ncbi:50S ribosomal protein L11 methyltransferase [Thermodesulfatator atlanticus]|uniref:50S ribosomal protein L11 methyltransferase n=1 Tax=Thermodesulfatator atlanticus TaxID=501497 RepID=UPI0003B766DC|nr:50S ribosomal protein L11 methyltransferase [Thermodesulfatator atlanticus]
MKRYWRLITAENREEIFSVLAKYSLKPCAWWQLETNILVIDVCAASEDIENLLHHLAGKDILVTPIPWPGFVCHLNAKKLAVSWLGEPSFQNIVIEPKGVFGSGLHPTTSLVISLLEKIAQEMPKPRLILDFGTGSGILAIIAARLWPKAQILAVDIDFEAAKECRANVWRNNLSKQIHVVCGTSAALSGKFDLILANVYLRVLTQESANLKSLLNREGLFVFSGFLLGSEKFLLNSYPGYQPLFSKAKDGWEALVLKR